MNEICIVGGGAAGMCCAVMLARKGKKVVLLERGERLGRKLSATGNGQGNVTNLHMGAEHYFSDLPQRVQTVLSRFGAEETIAFLESMGGAFLPDARGRVYPASRQASAVTDLFRRELARLGVKVILGTRVNKIAFDDHFTLYWEGGDLSSEKVLLAAGGRAAPQFGTDGSAYALAERFGHTVTPCAPVLVQLRTDPSAVRGLKGIRVDASLRVMRGRQIFQGRGDVLFTDCGVSGDAVFRASSHVLKGDTLLIDLVPDVPDARLKALMGSEEPLLCIVNNGLARALQKRADGDPDVLLRLLKNFPLTVTGTLGYEHAQVTRGGIPLAETDGFLMSRNRAGLYFAGEILNVDGECGGYNLQWAFASAYVAAEGMSL